MTAAVNGRTHIRDVKVALPLKEVAYWDVSVDTRLDVVKQGIMPTITRLVQLSVSCPRFRVLRASCSV